MEWKIVKHTWKGTITNNRILLFINALCVISILVLSVVAFRSHERLVIIPPNMNEKAVISWRSANEEYYKGFGLYVATLVGNITPQNVKFIADTVSIFVDPKIYPDMRAQLLSFAEDPIFRTSTNASYFAPREVVYEPSTSRVFVVGELVIAGFRTKAEKKPVVYEMTLNMERGLPKIVHFTSYPGTQAHTLKWEQANKKSEQAGE